MANYIYLVVYGFNLEKKHENSGTLKLLLLILKENCLLFHSSLFILFLLNDILTSLLVLLIATQVFVSRNNF